jgi:hypothetical protein
MNKALIFKNNRANAVLFPGAIALVTLGLLNISISLASSPESRTESDDYLSTILTQTQGKVFRYKKMPVKVFIESGSAEERSACERAFSLWRNGADQLISFESVSDKKAARVIIKFVALPDNEASPSKTSSDGGHTLMEWHFQKRLLRLVGRKRAYVPPQLVEINISALDLRPASQRDIVLQNLIAHELGHVLGLLAHSQDPHDLMYSKTDENSRLSASDVNTIRKLYRLKANVYL